MATVLAVPVHLFSFALALVGLVVLVKGVQPGASLIAIFCLGLAWEGRPRLGRRPKISVPRQRLEGLYELADEISIELGTDRLEGCVLTPWFEASTFRAGIRRRAYISIGLPLFLVLDPQERVAVLAHELAHLANRDPRRTAVLGTALHTLETWRFVLGSSFEGLAGLLWMIVTFIPMIIVAVYLWALRRLVLGDSRRSEFLADQLGATVAGSRPSASALRKLELEAEFHRAGVGAAVDGDAATFFDGFRTRAATIVAAGGLPDPDPIESVDATHPPTALRIAILEQGSRLPTVVLEPSRSAAIDRSLRPFEERMAADVIDTYRDRLHAASAPRGR